MAGEQRASVFAFCPPPVVMTNFFFAKFLHANPGTNFTRCGKQWNGPRWLYGKKKCLTWSQKSAANLMRNKKVLIKCILVKSWKYLLVQQKTRNETLCSRYFWTFGWKRVINFLAKSEKTVGPTTLVSVHGAKMNSEGTLRLVFPLDTESRHNCRKLIQSWCKAKADLAVLSHV